MARQSIISRDVEQGWRDKRVVGEKIASIVANCGGSWSFILESHSDKGLNLQREVRFGIMYYNMLPRPKPGGFVRYEGLLVASG